MLSTPFRRTAGSKNGIQDLELAATFRVKLGSVATQQGKYSLSYIRYLEAESIHVLREVAAEFERPVLLYSVGKDSSVLLRLAQNAFRPGRIPFPLMHVDTGYKFREMYEFREQVMRECGTQF